MRWHATGGLLMMLAAPLSAQSAVISCPQADSLLGTPPGGVHPRLQFNLLQQGAVQINTGGYATQRALGSHMVMFTVMGLTQPHPAQPQGFLAVHVEGPQANTILRKGVAPSLALELPDSITIRPTRVLLGNYDGPEAFATAPVTAVLTGPSMLALARAASVTIQVDSVDVSVPAVVLLSLQDAYRVGVCGYTP